MLLKDHSKIPTLRLCFASSIIILHFQNDKKKKDLRGNSPGQSIIGNTSLALWTQSPEPMER